MRVFQNLATTVFLVLAFATLATAQPEIPNIGFCELVKNPGLYFDKTMRVKATFSLATEAAYLGDDQCPLSHDDQVGVKYVVGTQGRDSLNAQIRRMRTSEFGGKALVTVVGILRNKSRRNFAWYRYQFDVERIEEMAPIIVPYEKTLQRGTTYRAIVRGDRRAGLVLATPLSMHSNYAVHLEWSNLKEFPSLKKFDHKSEKRIVFTVMDDDIKQMTERRWNRTVTLRILSLEKLEERLDPEGARLSRSSNHAQQVSAAETVPSDTLITLERRGCEGACPIYSLKIAADGVVEYRGKQFVRKTGRVKSKITHEQVRQLISEFNKISYYSLKDSYQHMGDGCPGQGIDFPSAITSIRINGKSKTITHDYGCSAWSADGKSRLVYPKELYELERRIDEIVGTQQWVK